MDQVKEAFQKVKQDMDSMKEELDLLKQSLRENNEKISDLNKIIRELTSQILIFNSKEEVFNSTHNPAQTLKIQTYPTHNPTDNLPFKPLNTQNMSISTGNRGVPTDRQTDRQTNQQTENSSFGEAIEVLNSLDSIKKEIRNKFKRITEQEFLVFSTIYQLSEEGSNPDYKVISQRLNLTESSIRDYVGRLIKKGIPVEKTKINNKIIQLSISEKLKKVTPLSVILQLRTL
ncbi:Uncharacterised protein [uncultured archaeon]|nr:Uncharacterised protein [uncultured archaeon]